MAERAPKVSVIIPTFNRQGLLGRAMGSVLDQGYEDFELIVVDDASTDRTRQTVEGFADGRVRYLRHDTNKGATTARNTGIRASRGQYIAFQDSDDEWLAGKLEKQMRLFEEAGDTVGAVYCAFLRIENGKETYIPGPHIEDREGDLSHALLFGNFVSTQTLVVRRDCLEKAGLFFDHLPRFQDWELAIRLSADCEFRLIDEALVRSYSTADSITGDGPAGARALEMILQRHHQRFAQDRRALANFYLLSGFFEFSYRSLAGGRTAFLQSIRLHPGRVKPWLALALSIFGRRAFNTAISVRRALRRRGPW